MINKGNLENTSFNKNEDEISLKEIIIKLKGLKNFLLTKIKIILISILFGSVLGFTFAFFDKADYKAVLTFAMEDDKGGTGGGISGAIGIASQLGIDLGSTTGGAFGATNIIELMKSRFLIEKSLITPVIIDGKTTNLANLMIDLYKFKKKWQDDSNLKEMFYPIGLNRKNYTLVQDSILNLFYKKVLNENLIIKQKDKKITIISLEVTSKSEIFSKLFAENLAKLTSDFYIETKTKKAKANVDILQNQADSIRNELNYSISGVALAADNVYNLNPAFNVKGVNSKKRQIDVQANTTILTQLVANLELAKINLRKETPLIQIIDRPILPLEKDKLSKLLSMIYGGFIAGFSISLYLVFAKFINKILS